MSYRSSAGWFWPSFAAPDAAPAVAPSRPVPPPRPGADRWAQPAAPPHRPAAARPMPEEAQPAATATGSGVRAGSP